MYTMFSMQIIIACRKGGTSIEDLAEKFPDMIIKVNRNMYFEYNEMHFLHCLPSLHHLCIYICVDCPDAWTKDISFAKGSLYNQERIFSQLVQFFDNHAQFGNQYWGWHDYSTREVRGFCPSHIVHIIIEGS